MKTLLVTFTAVFLAAVAFGESAPMTWSFDTERAGSNASGFSVGAGNWSVVADNSAPSPPNVLAQTAKSPDSTFNIVLIEGTSYADIHLAVMIKPLEGKNDQGGGLVWRAQDVKNYYVCRWNPLESNFNVYKVVNGRRSQLDGSPVKTSSAWHTLEVEMVSDHILCMFDGKKLLDVKDSTFSGGGKIGLWTKSDAQTHFDDLQAEVAAQGQGTVEEDSDED